ncbi:MAG: HAD family hydrolase [Leptolyngbyaceae bacterium]|nr:HAD family hydrolase [Leptolyngbyaceae bacterium]
MDTDSLIDSMRYLALATDYDGTLATEGQVDHATLAALERLRDSGRSLILVTGRQLDDLLQVFPDAARFDCVVAENGALLYWPGQREEEILGDRPPDVFIQHLQERQVDPLSVGQVIVATWEPYETTVIEAIRDLGLELQVIFNKGAVMVLPSGINKATGLSAALKAMKLSPHNVVGIGDAENDHAFLSLCECSVAVANALPMLKERADLTTQQSRGAGVIEVIERVIASDLGEMEPQLVRYKLLLGKQEDGEAVCLQPYGESVLLAGSSGGGKSTLATSIVERLIEQSYQFCLIDPEGDYENFEGAVVLGDNQRVPRVVEILELLDQPNQNVIVNLLGIGLKDRPAFLAQLLPSLQELRIHTGRPHWIVIDEAHHLLPASWDPASLTLPQQFQGMLMITVHPEQLAPVALSSVTTILTVGQSPGERIQAFCEIVGQSPPTLVPQALETGEAFAWFRQRDLAPFRFQIIPPSAERRRHVRKYAEGKLGEDKSFFFRGPQAKLNLRAQNLVLFSQLVEGVDDETWLYHLHRSDYSRWFANAIKDEDLAHEAQQIEELTQVSAAETRRLIQEAIAQRYTLPA